jgi:hypothetical protein
MISEAQVPALRSCLQTLANHRLAPGGVIEGWTSRRLL